MAAAKSKKTKPEQVFDVARPGKSAPSPTTKAIITKHPLLKDPMMLVSPSATADQAEGAVAEPAQSASTNTRLVIKPLHDNITPETTETTSDESAAMAAAVETVPLATLRDPEIPESAEVAPSASSEPTPDPKPQKPTASEASPTETPTAKTVLPKLAEFQPLSATDPDQSTTIADPTKSNQETASSAPNDADPNNSKNAAVQTEKDVDQATKDLAEHQAHIQNLINNKQYFLSINSLEKRRTKRFVTIGILLSLVLAAGWFDVALDSGILTINGIKAPTHFFSTTTSKPTPALPIQSAGPGLSATNSSSVKSTIQDIHANLEAYYSQTGYFPSELTTTNLPSISQTTLTAPPGTAFIYTPSPAGCTTSAKNCAHFTLQATNTTTNTPIYTKKSLE